MIVFAILFYKTRVADSNPRFVLGNQKADSRPSVLRYTAIGFLLLKDLIPSGFISLLPIRQVISIHCLYTIVLYSFISG